MAKIVQNHGKYHHMFPMTFYCDFCECVFDCESIDDVDIYAFLGEVFAMTNCPECESTVKNAIDEIKHEIEVKDYE